jgi:AraC-like DNA-binding protein
MSPRQAAARRAITLELEAFLRRTRIRRLHFAQAAVAPPPLAYVTSFPRLSVPLAGKHPMEISEPTRTVRLPLVRGHIVYVGRNCWNKPDWSAPVKVLTFLFGKRQIGVSLVSHDGQTNEPTSALKTTLSPTDSLVQNVLNALAALAPKPRAGPLGRLLAESLLHACLRLLRSPAPPHPRKAARTYETLCLYVQENFQSPLTRATVARSLGLTPNHISRVFRREGALRFSDYLTLVRIDRAKFMLREYGSSLKEIAAHCGYRDVAYFCRVFRRITKITPTEYRLKGL